MAELWQEGDISIPEGKLHYYRTGKGKPPMVFLHGLTDSGLCWMRAAEIFQDDYDVIMPDGRGHGASGNFPLDSFTIQNLVIDLIKIIKALELGSFILIGHSIGAQVAAATAANFPSLVKCLILEDPEWSSQQDSLTPAQRAAQARDLEKTIQNWKTQKPQQILADYRRNKTLSWNKSELETWLNAKTQVSPNVATLLKNDPLPLNIIIPKITCQTLLLVGNTTEGAVMDVEKAQSIVNLNFNIRVQRFAEAGHYIHHDQFELYMQTIKSFLARVGA